VEKPWLPETDKGQVAVWKLFQRKQVFRGMIEISALDLSALLEPPDSRLIVLDLRRRHEVEEYPYIIPGALLSTQVDLSALVSWLPPRTWVVLYAMDSIPKSCSRLRLLRDDLSFYVLDGGLRSWWRANLAMDSVEHYAGLQARG
jgi:rhodanese-related sulfurtransferase